MTAHAEYTLVNETPEMHASQPVAQFIEQEILRPSKQWIAEIIDGNQEQDKIILRTPDFVLLPDTERVNRYWRIQSSSAPAPKGVPSRRTLNWLSILHDRSIRTLRDLRGEHLHMLRSMLADCTAAIERETGIPADQVMAYVHYPPSVYQLHVHFSFPYGQFCHKDAFRIHGLASIINNLEIDPDYYRRATLVLPLYRQSLHYQALSEHDGFKRVLESCG